MTALTVERHDSEAGRWEFVRREPAPALLGRVGAYTGYVERSAGPFRRVEVPGTKVVVVFSFGHAITLRDPEQPGPAERRTSFVAGLSRTRVITEYDGEQHGIQVDLDPLAARSLLGLPLRELAGRAVALEDVLGKGADELVERLAKAPGWEARFTLLDTVLGRRLADARPPAPELVHAWERLGETHGRVEIGELAGEVGWSRRHLAARFGEEVGLTPKTLARILRFRRVASLLAREAGGRLAEIAYSCGYFDQAHLNRDVREFAGLTPGELLARRLPDGGGLAG